MSLELSLSENMSLESSLSSQGLVSYTFSSHVIALMRTLGGKCIMKIVDALSLLVKAIDLVEAIYVDIDMMDGSLLRILRLTMSTTNPSAVMIIGSLIEQLWWSQHGNIFLLELPIVQTSQFPSEKIFCYIAL